MSEGLSGTLPAAPQRRCLYSIGSGVIASMLEQGAILKFPSGPGMEYELTRGVPSGAKVVGYHLDSQGVLTLSVEHDSFDLVPGNGGKIPHGGVEITARRVEETVQC